MNTMRQKLPGEGNIGSSLVNVLQAAVRKNSHTEVPAATVLWPDKEGQWKAAIPALQKIIPGLCALGPYDPARRVGPAVWLKCAIAGLVPEVEAEVVPVIYLPGVSRAELRGIESCPRELQPLAELQFRGAFWSQANAKDWTVGAFLASKNGGLGLDVAQDRATLEALDQTLQAGALLEQPIAELKSRTINAEWLLSMLAPNPTRDLLQWMDMPEATRQQWGTVLWDIFVKRCKSDFGFDPLSDGYLVAAERLAKAEGKWSAVSELYRDSFSSFPNVYILLSRVRPPSLELFSDPDQLSGYPQVNEEGETKLRRALNACAAMDARQACAAVKEAEKVDGPRREWLWSKMGRSPLNEALGYLSQVAQRSATLPIGQTPSELAASYQQSGWQVDEAAIKALACVNAKGDLEAVSAALRAMYLPWLEDSAKRLQEAVKGAGGLSPLPSPVDSGSPANICTVFVDGLRYDVAKRLEQRLVALGATSLSAAWTSMPSVTASGKAWCSPVASFITGRSDDADFEPWVAADGKPLSAHNFRKLLNENGIQTLAKHETGNPQGRAWTEAGDLDHYGHEHGIRLARDMEVQLAQVVERVTELCEAGWRHIRIVTDHGWLLVPGGLPKSELAMHQVQTRWGRCAVLKGSAHSTSLTFGWDWCKDVQVAYAPGTTSFIAGADYAHGGISLQECLVPVLLLDVASEANAPSSVSIRSVTWRGLRCAVVVEGANVAHRVDIRSKAALASSSIAASVKNVEGGKASLAVADDEHLGAAAVVVVLGPDGDVLQKQTTTVGE